jgi:NADPH-dependent 2,4-dienoyl-CoA reductase/sulfur reductase-like enzyme/predicted acylesterase/phospholipase RssA
MTEAVDFLLIGGGLASISTAETLRREGAQGSIVILAAEPKLPYHRPPLSKSYLLKEPVLERLLIQPEAFYREQQIGVRPGTRALHLDPKLKVITCEAGHSYYYQRLLVATGVSVRQLPVANAPIHGIHYLRTIDDAERLRQSLDKAQRVLVLGSNFIAMELAAACNTRGIPTTLIAKETLLYDRLESPEISAFFQEVYRARGIELVFGETVDRFKGDPRVTGVITQSGKEFDGDLVLIGVGADPNIDFLRDSGLRIDDGVRVNQYLEASLPDVYAAGDVANFYDPVFRRHRRIEHWDNALKQGRIVARNMLGRHESYRAVSYFYSEVFDLNFNVIGDVTGATQRLVRGSPASASFAVLYLKGEHLTAAFLLNRSVTEEQAIGSLILNRIPIAAQLQALSDTTQPLSTWARQTVLILQGGGALGAFECGAIKALEEQGIRTDVVAGVSIGAFNAAIVASHPHGATAALEAFWRELAIYSPPAPNDELRRTLSAWSSLCFGVPKFFRPRWLMPMFGIEDWSKSWTSYYDTAPIKDLLRKYVDFHGLRDSPIRLLVSAVNVETAEIETFDSYIDRMTPEHLVASGSLPPGFPWTTIHGKHYWDGGIISNSPLDQVTERCGLTDKRVYIINLFPGRKLLPRNLPEVMQRHDEIVYAEKLVRDARTLDLLDSYGKLVNQLMGEVDPNIAEQIRTQPLYLETAGRTGPLSVTRIVHTGEPGEQSSKDFEFSAQTVEQHIVAGYEAARQALKTADE